ncbi:hypothetical protein GCM10027064_06030 [Microbacterium petrolearium]|jgi:hypothetical protein
MFLISCILFLAGFAAFAVAFMVPSFQAVVFALGILLVCAAMALPIHARSGAKEQR